MRNDALIAIAGGLLSAFLSLSFLGGSATGIMFAYFTSLPLFLIGFSLGIKPLTYSASAGIIIIGVFAGWIATSIYALIYFLPTWLITLFITSETYNNQTSTNNTSLLGRPLTLLALLGSVFIILGALSTGPTKLQEVVELALTNVFKKMMPVLDVTLRQNLIDDVTPHFLGAFGSSWLIMLIINAIIAQSLLVQFKKNLKPSPSYRNLDLPEWASWPLVTVASITLIGSYFGLKEIEFIGRNILIIVAIPYFFLGLAVVHTLANQTNFKFIYISLMYFVVLVSGWAAIVISAVGITEHWFQIRNIVKLQNNEK